MAFSKQAIAVSAAVIGLFCLQATGAAIETSASVASTQGNSEEPFYASSIGLVGRDSGSTILYFPSATVTIPESIVTGPNAGPAISEWMSTHGASQPSGSSIPTTPISSSGASGFSSTSSISSSLPELYPQSACTSGDRLVSCGPEEVSYGAPQQTVVTRIPSPHKRDSGASITATPTLEARQDPTCYSNGIAYDCGPTPTPSSTSPQVYTGAFTDLACNGGWFAHQSDILAAIQAFCQTEYVLNATVDSINVVTPETDLISMTFSMQYYPINYEDATYLSEPDCVSGFETPILNCAADASGMSQGGYANVSIADADAIGDTLNILFGVFPNNPADGLPKRSAASSAPTPTYSTRPLASFYSVASFKLDCNGGYPAQQSDIFSAIQDYCSQNAATLTLDATNDTMYAIAPLGNDMNMTLSLEYYPLTPDDNFTLSVRDCIFGFRLPILECPPEASGLQQGGYANVSMVNTYLNHGHPDQQYMLFGIFPNNPADGLPKRSVDSAEFLGLAPSNQIEEKALPTSSLMCSNGPLACSTELEDAAQSFCQQHSSIALDGPITVQGESFPLSDGAEASLTTNYTCTGTETLPYAACLTSFEQITGKCNTGTADDTSGGLFRTPDGCTVFDISIVKGTAPAPRQAVSASCIEGPTADSVCLKNATDFFCSEWNGQVLKQTGYLKEELPLENGSQAVMEVGNTCIGEILIYAPACKQTFDGIIGNCAAGGAAVSSGGLGAMGKDDCIVYNLSVGLGGSAA